MLALTPSLSPGERVKVSRVLCNYRIPVAFSADSIHASNGSESRRRNLSLNGVEQFSLSSGERVGVRASHI
jgi:hypothetical protein